MPPVAKRVDHDCEVRYTPIPIEVEDILKIPSKSEDGRIVLRDSRVVSRVGHGVELIPSC